MSLINSFNREPWTAKAACAECDPDLHFPTFGVQGRRLTRHQQQINDAKNVCRGCEVRHECLEYALENNERYGIWGCFDEEERQAMKRREYHQNYNKKQENLKKSGEN